MTSIDVMNDDAVNSSCISVYAGVLSWIEFLKAKLEKDEAVPIEILRTS